VEPRRPFDVQSYSSCLPVGDAGRKKGQYIDLSSFRDTELRDTHSARSRTCKPRHGPACGGVRRCRHGRRCDQSGDEPHALASTCCVTPTRSTRPKHSGRVPGYQDRTRFEIDLRSRTQCQIQQSESRGFFVIKKCSGSNKSIGSANTRENHQSDSSSYCVRRSPREQFGV